MDKTEANHLNTLLAWILGDGSRITYQDARAAAVVLATRAHARLPSGLTAHAVHSQWPDPPGKDQGRIRCPYLRDGRITKSYSPSGQVLYGHCTCGMTYRSRATGLGSHLFAAWCTDQEFHRNP